MKRLVPAVFLLISICFVPVVSNAATRSAVGTVLSDTTKTKIKKRVPKRNASKTNTKSTSNSTSSSSNDNDSFWVSCLSDCLANFLASLFSSDDENIEEPTDTVTNVTYKPMAAYRDIGNSRWQISAELSIADLANSALREEYRYNDPETGESSKAAYAIGVSLKFLPIKYLLLDASFDYTSFDGVPQYDYVIEDKTDSPYESHLNIKNISVGAGMFISFSSGRGFVAWNIGPCLYQVKESATIKMYEGNALVGERTDRISKWKVGADFKIEVGVAPIDKLLLAVYTRASIVPWKALKEKSLTLDYLDRSNFTYYSIGISIGTAIY